MQKYTVCTSKGVIHTTDWRSAVKVLELDLEMKKKELEKAKKETQSKDWDKEFTELLEQYIPKDPQEAIKKKYEGGEK